MNADEDEMSITISYSFMHVLKQNLIHPLYTVLPNVQTLFKYVLDSLSEDFCHCLNTNAVHASDKQKQYVNLLNQYVVWCLVSWNIHNPGM